MSERAYTEELGEVARLLRDFCIDMKIDIDFLDGEEIRTASAILTAVAPAIYARGRREALEEVERWKRELEFIAAHDGKTLLHPEPMTDEEDRAYQLGAAAAFAQMAAGAARALLAKDRPS